MKSDTLYTIHIQECIDRIQSYIAGIDQDKFMDSSLIQDAVGEICRYWQNQRSAFPTILKPDIRKLNGIRSQGFAPFLRTIILELTLKLYGLLSAKNSLSSKKPYKLKAASSTAYCQHLFIQASPPYYSSRPDLVL